MSLLHVTTLVLASLVGVLGFLLLRAAQTGKMWFLAIEPTRREQPVVFWWCIACTLWAFLGGAVGVLLLVYAVRSQVA